MLIDEVFWLCFKLAHFGSDIYMSLCPHGPRAAGSYYFRLTSPTAQHVGISVFNVWLWLFVQNNWRRQALKPKSKQFILRHVKNIYLNYTIKVNDIMLYKASAAIVHKVNLTQRLGTIWLQWFRSNDCEIKMMLKHTITSPFHSVHLAVTTHVLQLNKI